MLRTAPHAEFVYYPVFNVLIGMRVFVTGHFTLLNEYKHARASVEFSDNQFKADLRTS